MVWWLGPIGTAEPVLMGNPVLAENTAAIATSIASAVIWARCRINRSSLFLICAAISRICVGAHVPRGGHAQQADPVAGQQNEYGTLPAIRGIRAIRAVAPRQQVSSLYRVLSPHLGGQFSEIHRAVGIFAH